MKKILKYMTAAALFFGISVESKQRKKITVFVHGTLPPLINLILYEIDIPKGLSKAQKLNKAFFQGNVPALLDKADHKNFPLENAYVFGWPGTFMPSARYDAAKELYHELKNLDGDITLIGHSHGGSVALNVAKVADEHNDKSFKIENLILLGAPVQAKTKEFVISPRFKNVISFYSPIDWLQICDPQGLYVENCSLFSERNWPKEYNIQEIQVSYGKRDSWHLEFIEEKFLTHLPKALSEANNLKKINKNNCNGKLCIKDNKFSLNLL